MRLIFQSHYKSYEGLTMQNINVQNSKQKQISDIVSIVKLASLLLTGIILCKYFLKASAFFTQNQVERIEK